MDPENQQGQAFASAPAVPEKEHLLHFSKPMPAEPVYPAQAQDSQRAEFELNQKILNQAINRYGVPVSNRGVTGGQFRTQWRGPTAADLETLRAAGFMYDISNDVLVELIAPNPMTAAAEQIAQWIITNPPAWINGNVVQDLAVQIAIKREPKQKKETMLAKILRLYKASMTGDVRSPLVHIVGPPGCGKSTSVEQAAKLLDVNLHIINVSRMSPLDIEGVQMPTERNSKLKLLTATWWTDLKDGDIVLFDEFLRGFPEVYNGLLDILTSRRVGSFHLPKVFFIAASNSVATYDKALEDRLLHLTVEDPRKNKGEKAHMAKLLVNGIGLHPDMEKNFAMEQLIEQEVLPMFALLDAFKGKATVGGTKSFDGHSVRNLIGQARLRQVESVPLKELLEVNNRHVESRSLWQYIVLPTGDNPHPQFVRGATQLLAQKRDQLTEIQVQNLELNLELVELEAALKEEV